MYKLEQVQVLQLMYLHLEHNMLMAMYEELQLELMIDDGTNIQSAIGTTAGVLKVDLSATTANSTAVKVDGSAVTQPVSGTITANAGTNLNTSLLALDTSAAPTYTTAQLDPLSLTTSGALRVDIGATSANATAVKVDGSAVTQPVSGTIAVSNAFALDATLTGGTAKSICRGGAKGATTAADVTSTSQSVDRNALDVQIRTSSGVAVDTFGGGTQYADGTARGTATGTLLMVDDGTNIQSASGTTAGVLKVDLSATTANATAVSTNLAQIAATTTLTGNGVTGAGSQRVTIASDNTAFSVNAIGPTLTKGTQNATGFSVQNLIDAGRENLRFYAVAAAAGTTGTQTAITLTKSSNTSATSTAVSFVITSGKTFRITLISFATRGNATATAQTTTFNFRINTAGAVTTTSTPIILAMRSATPATANAWDRVLVDIPDGLEIAGDGTAQFGITAVSTYASAKDPTWDVTIIGFEY